MNRHRKSLHFSSFSKSPANARNISRVKLFFIPVFILIALCLASVVTCTAVYFGAAVAHRSEHDRSYHRHRDGDSGSYRPLTEALRAPYTQRQQQHGTLNGRDDTDLAMLSASRTGPQNIEENLTRQRPTTHSAIPLNIRLDLSNTKNFTSFVAKHVRTHSDAQRRTLQAWARATSTPLGRSALLASRRRAGPKVSSNSIESFGTMNSPTGAASDAMFMLEELAEPAGCEPVLQVVKVPLALNHSTIMFPNCVKVQRCSDCCGDATMKCNPTRTSTVEAEVQIFGYTGSHHQLDHLGSQRVELVAHDQCRCECRLKPSDCSNRQMFTEACDCRCKAEFEVEKCPLPLVWNADDCRCACPNGAGSTQSCPPGMHFDNTERCQCVPN